MNGRLSSTTSSRRICLLALLFCLQISATFADTNSSCVSTEDFPKFRCGGKDSKCIDTEMTCNGIKDCADNSDETVKNCTNGCMFNTTLLNVGETGQDAEWWYTCQKSRWMVSGCVIGNQRLKANQTFQQLTRQGIFWGKCEKLDPYHYMRQPYGCVDERGQNIENGKTFRINQLFWAKCMVNKTKVAVPDIGQVPVNEVKWQVVGCNDGSDKIVKEGQEFIWIIDPFRLLGVQILCQVPKKIQEWPEVQPVGCVANLNENTANAKPSFKVIRNNCYTTVGKQVYYCSITPRVSTPPPTANFKASTWSKDWLLNITDNSSAEIDSLKKTGYKECSEDVKTPPVVPAIPLPPGLPKPKREIHQSDLWSSVDLRSSRTVRGIVTERKSSMVLSKSINL